MSANKKIELITLAEALTRVGLDGLIPKDSDGINSKQLVVWTGYPKPFSCGHYAVRGFGPEEGPNDSKGKGRLYQKMCRVNQSFCGGATLFGWDRWSDKGHQLRGAVYVVIDTTPDSNDTVLTLSESV